MDQIILEGWKLPEVSRDNYYCYEAPNTVQVFMITQRVALEDRGGKIWRVGYTYDYMGNELMRRALAVLRSGAPFIAQVLPDNQDELVTSRFVVDTLDKPKMAFSRKDKAYWHRLSFTLREERPHD